MKPGLPYIVLLSSLSLLTGCTSDSSPITLSQPDKDLASHKIAATSEVKSIDSDWNQYENHMLGVSIKFPQKAVEERSGKITAVSIIENGEVVTFSRGYSTDLSHEDSSGKPVQLSEDLSVRTPYYTTKYLNDYTYPYQVYLARVENMDDLKKFVERAYGKGCMPGGPSGYTDRPGIESFTIEGSKECPSIYPVGDVIVWNPEKHVVIGYQPGRPGPFEIMVDSDLSQER